MHIPHLVRPRGQRVAGWTDVTWQLEPAEPHLGNAVFITDGSAVSYAESVMGYAAYNGVPIIGAPTAGANGNIKMVTLPSGAQVSFTGMKVTRHDGGQQHLIGVVPTIPLEPTIAGIAAGRDELLERAIAELRSRRPGASAPGPGAP
jgi:C-terminal processing protease CtpA/Prc